MNRLKLIFYFIIINLNLNASTLYEVKRDGKCGCQDDFLSIVIPMDFYFIDCNSSNLYPVLNEDGWFFYDLKSKSIEKPGDYLALSKYVMNTAIVYTFDSVFVINENFDRLFGTQKGTLERLGESNYFVKSVQDQRIIVDKYGDRLRDYIGNKFIKKGNYLLIHGLNHFPYYRSDSVENYVYEETIIDIQSGDTLYSTGFFEEIHFLTEDIMVARKNNGTSIIYFVINLEFDKIIYESEATEYLEFPIAENHNYFRVIDYESEITKTYNLKGDLLNVNTYDDAVYIPEIDLILTDKDFQSYLIRPSGDTVYSLNDWVLTRDYDFTFCDHKNNLHKNKLLVTLDSSLCLFDTENTKLSKLEYLTYENIMYTSIDYKHGNYILLAEDVSTNDSLTDIGVYYLYRLYDLGKQRFYSDVFTVYEKISEGIIRLENQEKVSYFELNKYLKESTFYKSSKILKSFFPYRQSLWNIVEDSSKATTVINDEPSFLIRVDTVSDYVYKENYVGHLISIINSTGKNQNINTQDGRLYLGTEVLYDNEWLPIDYMKGSWCGNSYFTLDMKNQSTWEVIMPRYTGYKKGIFRIKFSVIIDDQVKDYFSDQFEGSYNESQLLVLENEK